MFFLSGFVTGKKSRESSSISSSDSLATNSTTSANNAVTDPYGIPLKHLEDITNFPLFAALKSENIYLYGVKPYGMVLYQDGMGTYFDWPGLTPRLILPELSYIDYDNDGGKELAVTLYIGAGTQWSIMDLHILKIVKPTKDDPYKPKYRDYSLLGDDVNKWMTKMFTGTLSSDEKTINIYFDGNMYQTDNRSDYQKTGKFKGVYFGDIVEFNFDNNGTIYVKIAAGATYENIAIPCLFGYINGEVRFIGNSFTLENCTLNIWKN